MTPRRRWPGWARRGRRRRWPRWRRWRPPISALRRLRPAEARAALAEARARAARAGVGALAAEVDGAVATLAAPVARVAAADGDRLLTLDAVAALLASGRFVVDACRRLVAGGGPPVSLATRPVLFALARALAAAWPHAAPRATLITDAFGVRRGNDSHRARLRVEIGRLRRLVAGHADVHATADGFVWAPRRSDGVVLLLPPIDGQAAALQALLADGQAWSTSALALALGASQRTVQRALGGLEGEGKVRGLGRARARRWVAPPVTGFATTLLLPAVPG